MRWNIFITFKETRLEIAPISYLISGQGLMTILSGMSILKFADLEFLSDFAMVRVMGERVLVRGVPLMGLMRLMGHPSISLSSSKRMVKWDLPTQPPM